MNVLDLWSGTGSATEAFLNHGCNVISVDNDPQHSSTICKDILDVTVEELEQYGPFDFIWASPDCTVFSIANLHSRHFVYDGDRLIINSKQALEAIERVKHTLHLIRALRPKFWIMENPRAMLRKLPFMKKYERQSVTYCQYSGNQNRMKPTDLWGIFPSGFEARFCRNGASCHESSPRGSPTGTQKLSKIDRSRIPYGLSEEMYLAALNSERFKTLEDFI